MEIKTENVVVVQFKEADSGEFVNDVYAKIEVSLAAYDKGRLLYTSDSLGYTKFVTEGDGFGVINLTDLLESNGKQARIFSDLYKKYELGLRLTISIESTDYYKGFGKSIDVIGIQWIERPFNFVRFDWYSKNETFNLRSINESIDNIKDLRMEIKQAQLKYLEMKAQYETEVKNNVDLKLDRSNPWEPATFKNVLTRILEFQSGTLLPAIEYAKVAEFEEMQQRLQAIQNLFVVILQEYPKIKIEDGEGMPYMNDKLEIEF
jgi:hypothetical protein